jgi:mRNA interferase RelE/StbE
MNYKIIWDKKAIEFLRKISKEDNKKIIKKVNSIVDNPKHYLETLVNIKSCKLRIGNFRALIDLNENKKTIYVILIGHRKNIYKYIQRN